MGISRLFFKDTCVTLKKNGDQFLLSIEYGGQSSPLYETLKRWPELESIKNYFFSETDSRSTIPPGKLIALTTLIKELGRELQSEKKLIFNIEPEVLSVSIQNSPPNEVCLNYSLENGKLLRFYSQDVAELEDGWYRLGNVYWSYPTLSAIDQKRIRRKYIDTNELLEFLQRDLSVYAAVGVRYTCELHFDTIPALELAIESVESDQVRISRKWHCPPEHIDRDFDLGGYVIAGKTLRPGIRPAVLESHLSFNADAAVLRGIEIARFIDEHYSALKPWIIRGTETLESSHGFVSPPFEWILSASAIPTNGINKAVADPIAVIRGHEYSVDELIQLMREPYAHIAEGWIRRRDLYTLGLNESRQWSGTGEIGPIELTARQIVYRGDQGLTDPWKYMRMNGASWCSSSVKQRAVREHLDFLIEWGVSGGITGGYEAAAVYGARMIENMLSANESMKILVIGCDDDIDAFSGQTAGYRTLPASEYKKDGVYKTYLARYDKLSGVVCEAEWDVIVLIEPDEIYARDEKYIESVADLKAVIRIGFFVNHPDLWKQALKPAMRRVMAFDDDWALISLLVQNPRSPKPLPQSFNFIPTAVKPATDAGVDYVAPGFASVGEAIPPKREQSINVDAPVLFKPSNAISVGSASTDERAERFVLEARRLCESKGDPEARHVPFSSYYPTYSDMSMPQRKWYFRLRDLIRLKEYPDTDLSYLFVRIYELINLVACDSPVAAYDELMDIWLNYRDKYPKLDAYMGDWTFDFINIRQCGINTADYIARAPIAIKAAVNVFLTQYAQSKPLILPVAALETLAGYYADKSKFFQSGRGDLIKKILPMAVAFVDSMIKDNESKGLLGRFDVKPANEHRSAFQGAVVGKNAEYDFYVLSYCEDEAFCRLVNQILRYTENALRRQCDYSAKLRGVELANPYAEWIDYYIDRQFANKIAKPATSLVSLDSDKIKRLRDDSDDVRELLIASVEREEAFIDGIDTPVRPDDTPDGLLTDLEPVNRILHEISSEQKRIIERLRSAGWELVSRQCARAFPGMLMEAEIDAINSASIKYLGVWLIVYERDDLVVADDYRDELDYLIGDAEAKDTDDNRINDKRKALDVLPESADNPVTDGDGWTDFFKTCDIAVIEALLKGDGALRRLASKRGDMPDLLIDSINETAIATVGDLVVYDGEIEEEYLPKITEYLRKA